MKHAENRNRFFWSGYAAKKQQQQQRLQDTQHFSAQILIWLNGNFFLPAFSLLLLLMCLPLNFETSKEWEWLEIYVNYKVFVYCAVVCR